MKKTLKALIAISLTFVLLFSLCSCSLIAATTAVVVAKNMQQPEDVTVINGGSDSLAAIEGEDGNIVRDEAGNVIVYVTDVDGNYLKDENGEFETTPATIDRHIVVGRRIEAPTYSINIPDGWSDKLTTFDLDIVRDGTKDNLRIGLIEDSTFDETLEQRTSVINIAKTNFPSAETGNKSITIGDGIKATYNYVWVEDTGVREDDGKGNLTAVSSFAGFIVFEYAGDVYSCSLISNNNMNEDIDEITDILNTIEFIKK